MNEFRDRVVSFVRLRHSVSVANDCVISIWLEKAALLRNCIRTIRFAEGELRVQQSRFDAALNAAFSNFVSGVGAVGKKSPVLEASKSPDALVNAGAMTHGLLLQDQRAILANCRAMLEAEAQLVDRVSLYHCEHKQQIDNRVAKKLFEAANDGTQSIRTWVHSLMHELLCPIGFHELSLDEFDNFARESTVRLAVEMDDKIRRQLLQFLDAHYSSPPQSSPGSAGGSNSSSGGRNSRVHAQSFGILYEDIRLLFGAFDQYLCYPHCCTLVLVSNRVVSNLDDCGCSSSSSSSSSSFSSFSKADLHLLMVQTHRIMNQMFPNEWGPEALGLEIGSIGKESERSFLCRIISVYRREFDNIARRAFRETREHFLDANAILQLLKLNTLRTDEQDRIRDVKLRFDDVFTQTEDTHSDALERILARPF
eukprot:ANDGO_01947.mRNA.1 hypothetical protein